MIEAKECSEANDSTRKADCKATESLPDAKCQEESVDEQQRAKVCTLPARVSHASELTKQETDIFCEDEFGLLQEVVIGRVESPAFTPCWSPPACFHDHFYNQYTDALQFDFKARFPELLVVEPHTTIAAHGLRVDHIQQHTVVCIRTNTIQHPHIIRTLIYVAFNNADIFLIGRLGATRTAGIY